MRRVGGVDRYGLEVHLRGASLWRGECAVLSKVSWRIRPGERWVLAGGNGAGKTQLLKVVAGIVWPAPTERPTLRYRLGKEVLTVPYGVKDEIAYLGAERQDRYERFGWNAPAAAVAATGLQRSDIPLQKPSATQWRRVHRMLGALGVAPLAPRPFLSLSYGERRVVLLARALNFLRSIYKNDQGVDPS